MRNSKKQSIMKNILNSKTAGVITITLLIFITSLSYGATFTAIASGNWSSTTTWGGSVPPSNITSDQVIIPSGVNVTMDNNVTLNGAIAVLNVEGTLSSASSTALTIMAGTVSGTGTIHAGSLTCETAAVLSFTGSITANTLVCNALNLLVAADIMVSQSLQLGSGILNLQTGSSLDVGTNATIVVSGGAITLSGGTVGLSGLYNVSYISASSIAGVELTGSGLNDVSVNVGPANTVTLSGNLNVSGTLYLTTGTLVLAGHNLTITGNLASSGTGNISSTVSSDISISTPASLSGVLTFSSSGNAVNNFTVSIGGDGSVTLGSDIMVQGILNLVSGYLNTGNYNVEIGMSGSISGGANTSYVITGMNGSLSMHLTAGAPVATIFPVGTSTHLCPTAVLLNSGSASGQVYVGVAANVYAQGTSGVDISATQPVVDATWFIHSDITSNLNMLLTLMWEASAEVNAFDRNAAYISHNVSGSWDAVTTASANIESSGMYSMSRNSITSLSPFAVFDQNTIPTAVADEPADLIAFDIYPNPAADFVNVKYPTPTIPTYIEVVNILGAKLYSARLTRTNMIIPVEKYLPGNYFIRIYNDNMSTVKKFVKM